MRSAEPESLSLIHCAMVAADGVPVMIVDGGPDSYPLAAKSAKVVKGPPRAEQLAPLVEYTVLLYYFCAGFGDSMEKVRR